MLRKWRRFPAKSSILDLKDAYMQIHAHDHCSRVQRISFEGQVY